MEAMTLTKEQELKAMAPAVQSGNAVSGNLPQPNAGR